VLEMLLENGDGPANTIFSADSSANLSRASAHRDVQSP